MRTRFDGVVRKDSSFPIFKALNSLYFMTVTIQNYSKTTEK